MSQRWNRPEIPNDGETAMFLGVVLILGGIVGAMIAGGAMYAPDLGINPFLTFAISAPAVSTGALIVAVCSITREIRQAAYEAALRAGEVETKKPGAA